MFYITHLALPLAVVIGMAIAGPPLEFSVSGFERAVEQLAYSYIGFAAPHWIWASISAYFDASKGATVGGFIGAHVLLLSVWLLVATSSSHEAANGWFIYKLGWPIAVAIGGATGSYFAKRKPNASAAAEEENA